MPVCKEDSLLKIMWYFPMDIQKPTFFVVFKCIRFFLIFSKSFGIPRYPPHCHWWELRRHSGYEPWQSKQCKLIRGCEDVLEVSYLWRWSIVWSPYYCNVGCSQGVGSKQVPVGINDITLFLKMSRTSQ
jgi:hypothetical protein